MRTFNALKASAVALCVIQAAAAHSETLAPAVTDAVDVQNNPSADMAAAYTQAVVVDLPAAQPAVATVTTTAAEGAVATTPALARDSLPAPAWDATPTWQNAAAAEIAYAASYGPADPHNPLNGEGAAAQDEYRTVGAQIGAVRWEFLGALAYISATNTKKLINVGGRGFHFQDEGWFGRDTNNLGVDKLAHAYNSYLFSELFYHRIRRHSGHTPTAAFTGALLGWSVQMVGEIFDGFKKSAGFSTEDLITNTVGAGFSYLRNAVPGMREKVDFRVLIMPNSDIYTLNGKRHYEQQRFLLAFTLAGFKQFESTPLRFVELQVGYRGTGYSQYAIDRGERLRRDIFFGVGLNLSEIFFPTRRSDVGRVAGTVLDYLQIPYTAVHF